MEATWGNDVMGGGGVGFLTCPAHWITGRGGEDLRGEVLKRHHFSVVLHDGLQVQRPLLIAGPTVKDITQIRTWWSYKMRLVISDRGILVKQVAATAKRHHIVSLLHRIHLL